MPNKSSLLPFPGGRYPEHQGFHLVFSGINLQIDKSRKVFLYKSHQTLAVGKTAGQEDRVDSAFRREIKGADFLDNLVAHRFQIEPCFLIACGDSSFDFNPVACADVGEEAALTHKLLLQFFFRVFPGIADVDQLERRRVPALSGVKGPSPPRALFTSTTFP